MKIMTIMGSPRKHGNTAAVLQQFERLAGQAHQIDRANITDCTVHGCLGCGVCQKVPDIPGCTQHDDAVGLFERMLAADVVVYATPLYSWDFTAQMKALVDRHYCLTKWGDEAQPQALLAGKRVALLVTCAGPVEENADLIQIAFDRAMEYAGCQVIGKYIVPNCTTPDELGDKAQNTARQMQADIVGG